MPQSVGAGNFNGTASDCCWLCQSTNVFLHPWSQADPTPFRRCAAFTFDKKAMACILHPNCAPLGNATRAPPSRGASEIVSGVLDATSTRPRPAPLPPQRVHPPPAGAKNVVLFISDDLRPELFAAYKRPLAVTPHLDKLAARATVMNRAYCQQAICGPTRNSFLSGRRPQRTQSWNFHDHFREPAGGFCGDERGREEDGRAWVSLPGYFLTHGYTSLGGGKTFHGGLPPYSDGALSWSWWNASDPARFPPYAGPGYPGVNTTRDYPGDPKQCRSRYIQGGGSSCPDNTTDLRAFTDYQTLVGMLDSLDFASRKRKADGTPFFLSYGIHRPHLPFHFPTTFPGPDGRDRDIWQTLGPTEAVPLPGHPYAPTGMPPIAFTYEMDGSEGITVNGTRYPIPGPMWRGGGGGGGPNYTACPFCGPALPNNATRIMRKAYYGAVSWVDYLVGAFLAALEAAGHADDTVIALIGDHGWQLGEHNVWGKHTNFELGARVPLIIRAAGQSQGIVSDQLVESVDLYPTLAALAGLPPPEGVDGTSLAPLWQEPNPNPPLKTAAFSEYPRCAPPNAPWTPEPGYSNPQSCVNVHRSNFTVMGYSVRTDAFRCTFWMPWDGVALAGDFLRDPVAVELYSHAGDNETDWDQFENVNIAHARPDVVAQHMRIARARWQKNKTDSTGDETGEITRIQESL